MSEQIEMVMNLSCCSREEAMIALHETDGDVVEAVSQLVKTPSTLGAPKPKERTPQQKQFDEMRKQMNKLTVSIESGFTSNPRDCAVLNETQDHHEETVQQSNCSQVCPPSSPQLEAQTPETVCPSQSIYSFDLPLNNQIKPCSGHQSLQ